MIIVRIGKRCKLRPTSTLLRNLRSSISSLVTEVFYPENVKTAAHLIAKVQTKRNKE